MSSVGLERFMRELSNKTKMENIMKLLRYLLPLVLAVGFTSSTIYAYDERGQDNTRFDEELNQRDFDALREFVNSKRTIDTNEKGGNLVIAGDVRTEWRHLNERYRHKDLRGGKNVDNFGIKLSRNDFDIEFNLRFDYYCDKAWAIAHLQFDNSAGVDDNERDPETQKNEVADGNGLVFDTIHDRNGDPCGYHGSGTCEDICLKKAYIGYNICNDCGTRFDIEIGRRNLYNVFDSQVQFLSRFDGILLKYSSNWECVADWYWNLAGFVVDERSNHFAWVTEVGFLNICDTCIDFKYSFIDWKKNGSNRYFCHNPRGFKFMNSQWTLAYHLGDDCFCGVQTKIFGAVVWNHYNHKNRRDCFRGFNGSGSGSGSDSVSCEEDDRHHHHKNRNIAGYVGVRFGDVCSEGDWALEVQWQYVGAHSIPDNDVSGIGTGNVLDWSFTADGRGNVNYQGVRVEGLYALTDNLTIDSMFEYSRSIDSHIGGGKRSYSKFEIEAIYAF